MVALGDKESISHSSADDKGVDLVEQVVDNAYLIGYLRTAENGDKRSLRVFKSAAHKLDFLLDKVAAYSGEIIGNARCGGVCSVSRAKSVIDIYISQRSQSL